jgi:hypothetical protein
MTRSSEMSHLHNPICLAILSTEWIPVIDTALKVGLGAVIAGLSGLATNWLRAKTDREQFLLKHELESMRLFVERDLNRLEQGLEFSHEYFESVNKYLNVVGGILSGLPQGLREAGCMISEIESRLIPGFNQELATLENQQIELQSARNKSVTLLGLIGEEKLSDLAGKSLEEFEAMRFRICVKKELPPWSEFERLLSEYQSCRIEFKELCSEAYERRKKITSTPHS